VRGAPEGRIVPIPEEAREAERRLRTDLDAIFRAALDAVEPEALVDAALSRRPVEGDRVFLIAVGKAAPPMARAGLRHLEGRLAGGVIVATEDVDLPEEAVGVVKTFRGGHPLPTPEGVRGARAVLNAARAASAEEIPILLLLSGGGSALLTLPAEGVTLADVRATTRLLQEAGAWIGSLNAVRKHLDRIKGGCLARAAAPAPVRALDLSDVVGDRLDVIASGPVHPDPTTFADALDVLDKFEVRDRVPPTILRRLEAGSAGELDETPGPGEPFFENVYAEVVGNAGTAAEGAVGEARSRGYDSRVLRTDLTGESREVGRELGSRVRELAAGRDGGPDPACLVAAGETTVTVRGPGRGGRNQELALGAALELDGVDGAVLASLGTDGIDGPTDAAGAVVDGVTLHRARARGLDPGAALARNDSYPFFRALGDLLVTGPTGTNVMDVVVALVGPPPP